MCFDKFLPTSFERRTMERVCFSGCWSNFMRSFSRMFTRKELQLVQWQFESLLLLGRRHSCVLLCSLSLLGSEDCDSGCARLWV